jgi:hypothetical protein
MNRAIAAACGALAIQVFAQVKPLVSERQMTGQVNVVRVAPRFATAIRMPEAVSSVIVGDPQKFLAEYSDKEPALVLVKPVVEEAAESNLLVTTVRGRQVSFVLRSEGPGSRPVDFLLNYRPAGSFLIEEGEAPNTGEIPETKAVSVRPVAATAAKPVEPERDPLEELVARQQRAQLPILFGERAPEPNAQGDPVKVGVSEVVDQGRQVLVLFSVVNPQAKAIAILPPQVQLAGKVKKGVFIRRSRWGTSEQLAVSQYRLSRRRIGPGERADGLVVFDRPSFKQSNETLFLQVAESGAVDRPALAPIGFGVSSTRKDVRDGE